MNTDLVVHMHRMPEGEWIGIRAETNYGPDGIGTTIGTLFDETGAVGAIQQSVLVRPALPASSPKRYSSRPVLERSLPEFTIAGMGCDGLAGLAALASALVHQPQSRCGALGYGLLHAIAVGLRPFVLMDQHGAVVLHLEHVLGDRLADAVSGALVEVDFDPHDHSYWTMGRKAFDAVDEAAVQQVGLTELDGLQPSQQLAEQVSQLGLRQLVTQAEVRPAAAEAEMRVG